VTNEKGKWPEERDYFDIGDMKSHIILAGRGGNTGVELGEKSSQQGFKKEGGSRPNKKYRQSLKMHS